MKPVIDGPHHGWLAGLATNAAHLSRWLAGFLDRGQLGPSREGAWRTFSPRRR